MCVLSYRAQSRGWYLKKSVFLKQLLSEQQENLAKNQAKSFDFSRDLQKKISQKAQRSTILEGGDHMYPLPHLVVNSNNSYVLINGISVIYGGRYTSCSYI